MRRALPHLTALVCGVAAALVVGCGDRSNLVPASDASTLNSQLAEIRAAVNSGDCPAAEQALTRVRATALGLPARVDRRLRQRINSGIKALQTSVPTDCAAAQTPTTTETTPTVTTVTTPTTTETTPTVTTPTTTETTPTVTTPTTTTEPVPTDTAPTVPAPADTGGATGAPAP